MLYPRPWRVQKISLLHRKKFGTWEDSFFFCVKNESHAMFRGLIIRREYTPKERESLLKELKRWGGDLALWDCYSWEECYAPERKKIRDLVLKAHDHGIHLIIGFRPGDLRYCSHARDQENLVGNVKDALAAGADGIALLADDTHPQLQYTRADAEAHAALLSRLAPLNEPSLFCGEQYWGCTLDQTYWGPILQSLPEATTILWTGPRIWNATLAPKDLPDIPRLALWENYFTTDSENPGRVVLQPYAGRSPHLVDRLEGVLLNPDNVWAWQYATLSTAFKYLNDPQAYDPEEAWRTALLSLHDDRWQDSHESRRQSYDS